MKEIQISVEYLDLSYGQISDDKELPWRNKIENEIIYIAVDLN